MRVRNQQFSPAIGAPVVALSFSSCGIKMKGFWGTKTAGASVLLRIIALIASIN